jgi:23S rRNA (cytidine1920-2'-O)/16S rRNA (cytidine1409-2'-O)-methyltransferase
MGGRLDNTLVAKGLVRSRSQAENYIKLGQVYVDGNVATKAGMFVNEAQMLEVRQEVQYVSRAALKLASVADKFQLNFNEKIVLDVGSSTGGFTDFALRGGAKKVIAVDVGTNQLHPTLLGDPRIDVHEQTDIRTFLQDRQVIVDIVVIDVSFVSLREVLPFVASAVSKNTQIIAMVKPQFEAYANNLKHKGVIKNDRIRRDILKSFEEWIKKVFITIDKTDSAVAGDKGNLERFYLLKKK